MLELKEIKLKNGQNLILRKANGNDAEKMIEYLNTVGGESDNLLFGKNEFHFSIEQEKEYLNNLNIYNSEIAISVKKEYWGLGIGSAVMSELIEFARNNDIRNIELGVKASNSKAIKLYEKFGLNNGKSFLLNHLI